MKSYMLTNRTYQVIGFAGYGQNRILSACILYLSKYKEKILIIDYSETAELRAIIPLPKELEDKTNIVLSYHNLDYINADGMTQIQDFAFDYDIVLVDFGRNIAHSEAAECDCVYYLTDMLRHNILLLKHTRPVNHEHLILCDYFPGMQSAYIVAQELNFPSEGFTVLPYDDKEHIQMKTGIPIDQIMWRSFSSQTRHLVRMITDQLRSEVEDRSAIIPVRFGKSRMHGREKVWS